METSANSMKRLSSNYFDIHKDRIFDNILNDIKEQADNGYYNKVFTPANLRIDLFREFVVVELTKLGYKVSDSEQVIEVSWR